jgi:hypothetical protein
MFFVCQAEADMRVQNKVVIFREVVIFRTSRNSHDLKQDNLEAILDWA